YETYFTSTDYILENNIPGLLMQFNNILAKGFDGHHYIAGLASHFRDLLVCKNSETVELLEVGEETKEKYLIQSQKTSQAFLLQGIELANDCDLKYKSSRNQRLLVELCLMQLASITFDGEKKKSEPFIISPLNFKNSAPPTPASTAYKISSEEKVVIRDNEYATQNSAPNIEVQLPASGNFEANTENKTPVEGLPDPEKTTCRSDQYNSPQSPEKEEVDKIKVSVPAKEKISGLSLSSIRKKKEMLARQPGQNPQTTVEKDEDFTETQLHAAWDDYIHRLKNKGEKILASILETDMPKITGRVISLELPAETMKNDLERGQNPLM